MLLASSWVEMLQNILQGKKDSPTTKYLAPDVNSDKVGKRGSGATTSNPWMRSLRNAVSNRRTEGRKAQGTAEVHVFPETLHT